MSEHTDHPQAATLNNDIYYLSQVNQKALIQI